MPAAIPHDLIGAIEELRKQRNAVILAHYYQEPDIQDVADYIGDSLQLARAAQETSADVILFCGVHFMAETAKILNPERIVLIPDMAAGCSLADACPAPMLQRLKDKHTGAKVVSYINCSAAVKAISDIICTSSNAERVVRSIPEGESIIFAPDRNLGAYVAKQTGRDMILWPGTCIVHETFSERKLIELVSKNPLARVVAHPECEPTLLRHAHFIGSTSALLNYVKDTDAPSFIVATEPGILHQMKKAAPAKELIPLPGQDESCSCNECPHMKRNTLEKMYLALRDLQPRLEMDEALRLAAKRPLDAMLALP
ncbi:MAG: quinolinate synthase NadA [Deltaproteobacteria bacterium]|nr:quinolinate synthase NadA [Deltaproteobacteria bacterium]